MPALLIDSILKHVPLSEKEQQRIPSFFQSLRTRKHQYLLQEGQVCRYEYFVLKGCCRQFEVDEEGRENVLQFSVEGWWISDLDSMLTQQPSSFNIDVLESGEVLQIDKVKMDELFNEIPAFERYYRIISQKAFIALQRRILFFQKPALERYEEFVTRYPFLEQRLPQHQIAAYLGITKESLSRLRRKS
jgi:cAMP-binding proteins - catabolite gene activator and regulatory subunit of cAMP-dependent protein kinases